VVAPHARWLAGSARFDERHVDAALGEVHRQSQADWTTTDD
jgi:hypothetical protein